MTIAFPSREFDDAVAAVCHGTVSDEQAKALNLLLRSDAHARDEYLLRLELHARLGSEPDLFAAAEDCGASQALPEAIHPHGHSRTRLPIWGILAVAASLADSGGRLVGGAVEASGGGNGNRPTERN